MWMMFSGGKSTFGEFEILLVGHLCHSYKKKAFPSIGGCHRRDEGRLQVAKRSEAIHRCLCILHIWIPHYVHIVELLCGLLKKGQKSKWEEKHTKANYKRLKEMLLGASTLRNVVYKEMVPIFITINTSPTRIRWVINQEGQHGGWYTLRLWAKCLVRDKGE